MAMARAPRLNGALDATGGRAYLFRTVLIYGIASPLKPAAGRAWRVLLHEFKGEKQDLWVLCALECGLVGSRINGPARLSRLECERTASPAGARSVRESARPHWQPI